MRRLRKLGALLLLGLYLFALLGAPAAHEFAGADPRHSDAAPHDLQVSRGEDGGSPSVHLAGACAVCLWYAANRGVCLLRSLLLERPAPRSALPPLSEGLPHSGLLGSLAEARAPPSA